MVKMLTLKKNRTGTTQTINLQVFLFVRTVLDSLTANFAVQPPWGLTG